MVVIAVRFASIFLCGYSGYLIADLLNENYIYGSPQRVLSLSVGVLLGLLIGFVIGGILGRYTADIVARAEGLLNKVQAADIFFGFLGGLLGLIAASLPSIALFRFGYPGYTVSLIMFVTLFLVGMRLGMLKRSELASMFKLGPEFKPSAPVSNSKILDTSVIIDGRIVDIARSGFVEGNLVVPRFVLNELQSIADSGDSLKRNRGRRGLEALNALKRLDNVVLEITDQDFPEIMGVDGKLVALSKVTGMPLTTNDFNLNRVAEIQGIRILNINELANALKPTVLPGEELEIKIIREGKEPEQGIGYLDDGTMIVVENGKKKVGSEVVVVATSVIQTPAGKMIFSGLRGEIGED
ncbi:MAG: TRAM domain-containing protein [Actinobacteria bacterium]|nr:TRAM domain-containing protein [Actinomycetota bacterium]